MEVILAPVKNEMPEMRRAREIQLSFTYYEQIRSIILQCIDELVLKLIQVPEYGPLCFNLEYFCFNVKDEIRIKEIEEILPVKLIKIINKK